MKTSFKKRLFRRSTPLMIICAATLSSPDSAAAATSSLAWPDSACEPGETWRTPDDLWPTGAIAASGAQSLDLRQDFRQELSASLSKQGLSVRGFSHALALREQAPDARARLLAEYWLSRSLYQAGLLHIAQSGFQAVLNASDAPATIGIKLAALRCLIRIHSQHSALTLPDSLLPRIEFLQSALGLAKERDGSAGEADLRAARLIVADASLLLFLNYSADAARASSRLPAGKLTGPLARALALLSGSGPHELFAQAIASGLQDRSADMATKLEAFFAEPSNAASSSVLSSRVDQIHAVLARAHFAAKRFDRAVFHLKAIKKSSNELAQALSELSWSYLADDKYAEAIGTALNLDAGGLRHTFAPEAPMVMAMSLNELCQFPQSLKAVEDFKRAYESSYRWLGQWKGEPLYPQAVKFLRKQPTETPVPDRIASEWVRSPVFISHQDQINLLFVERAATTALAKSGGQEQRRIETEVRKLAQDLLGRIRMAKTKLKPGETADAEHLPSTILKDLVVLKKLVNDYRRLGRAAGTWKTVLRNHQGKVPQIEKRLVQRINDALAERSRSMLTQLEEVAENNQLIEVEIYNGASQDIIWQNAHPEYRKVAQKIHADAEARGRAPAEAVWDWGRAPSAAGPSQAKEIWEDELGSFKVNLFDNCSNKERYLALRRKNGNGS